MKVFLVFTHDWNGLDFKAIYTNVNDAIEHANALKLQNDGNTEIHQTTLYDFFSNKNIKYISTSIVWTTQMYNGVI